MGSSAPVHLPKHLLLAMVAYRIQADALGDLDVGMVQMLKADVGSGGSAAITKLTDKLDRRNQELAPGAILTRQWNGRDHRVMVLADSFAFEGQTYDACPRSPLRGRISFRCERRVQRAESLRRTATERVSTPRFAMNSSAVRSSTASAEPRLSSKHIGRCHNSEPPLSSMDTNRRRQKQWPDLQS